MYKRTKTPKANRWIMQFPGNPNNYHIASDRNILLGELFKKHNPEYSDMTPFAIVRRFEYKARDLYRKESQKGNVTIEPYD